MDLLPVIPGDSVLLNVRGGRSTKRPWPLNFPGATPDMEFLKLNDEKPFPLAGWDEYFFGKERREEADTEAARGFFSYYPVTSVKPGATVIATFADPQARDAAGKEPPFFVSMNYGKGKVFFLGSGEMYRMRQISEGVFYERFWTKLGRFVSSGSRVRQTRRGGL